MKLPENPSVLAQVKVMLQKLPLGTSLTLYDLMRCFPDHDENNLSATFSSLMKVGCFELEDKKVFAVYKDKKGREYANTLKSYKMIKHPDLTELHSRPVYIERKRNEEAAVKVVERILSVSDNKKKFRKIFACNPNIKFDIRQIEKLGEELIYICDNPLYDGITEEQSRVKYEWTMVHRLKGFDPKIDALAIYGDNMILAMAMFYLSSKFKRINVARFSARNENYVIRAIDMENFAL